MSSMPFSGREQIVRDLGLNRIILICIVRCHFLGGFNDFGGWDQTSQDLPEISDETQLSTRSPQKISKADKPASPADITSGLAPDLLSHGREPEYYNFKHS